MGKTSLSVREIEELKRIIPSALRRFIGVISSKFATIGKTIIEKHKKEFRKTRRERLKSAVYLGLKKGKVFKMSSGRFFMKNSEKRFRNTQRMPVVLGKGFRSSDIARWAT